MKKSISPEEIQKYRAELNRLSNSAQFKKAYALARSYMLKYPRVPQFAADEAVFSAEDTTGLSQKEINRRYNFAKKKLLKIMKRMRGLSAKERSRMRNEYYWFSKQPLKQYRLGLEEVRSGDIGAYYSQGVGSAMLARRYAELGRTPRMLYWARISEKAWAKFFKEEASWFNGYYFLGMAHAFQGSSPGFERAIRNISRYSGKPMTWKAIKEMRQDILKIIELHNSKSKTPISFHQSPQRRKSSSKRKGA